ncbi:MAG: hypothetical protein M3Y42_14330 [Actinomycetota bacterium]|nr:hypothetical protein [Actinomycetota bacterium]
MNVLVSLLAGRPGALDQLVVRGPQLPLYEVMRFVDLPPPDPGLLGGSVLSQAAERAYLPVLSAAQMGIPDRPPFPPHDRDLTDLPQIRRWVAFLDVPSAAGVGMLVPDDRSRRPNVTAFVPMFEDVNSLSLRFTLELPPNGWEPVGYQLGTGGDCGEPIGNYGCERNLCGECVHEVFYSDGFRCFACHCPHSQD